VIRRIPPLSTPNTNTTEALQLSTTKMSLNSLLLPREDPPNGGVGSDIELRLTKSMKRKPPPRKTEGKESYHDDVVITRSDEEWTDNDSGTDNDEDYESMKRRSCYHLQNERPIGRESRQQWW
jgi:hypothetical protein